MKIGIDLDGTLWKTYEKLQKQYKVQRGKELNLEMVLKLYSIRNPIDKLWFWFYFRDPESYQGLETYPYAIFSILKLKEIYEIYFLTMRPNLPKIQEVTIASVKEIVDIQDDHIVFCTSFSNKLQVIEERGISVLIEDNLNSDPIPDGITVIILKRVWNSKIEITSPRIKVVEDWQEVLKLLL
jgi:5'(3')-deoxyribonucleotidase